MTNKNPKPLTMATCYFTKEGLAVIPIKLSTSSPERAIFVADTFHPTPFVSWEYQLNDDGTISLYRGEYFQTLDRALEVECDGPKPLRLKVSFYCPECEMTRWQDFTFDHTSDSGLLDIVRDIEDHRLICPDCGRVAWRGVTKVELHQDLISYELPLWRGPVSEPDGE